MDPVVEIEAGEGPETEVELPPVFNPTETNEAPIVFALISFKPFIVIERLTGPLLRVTPGALEPEKEE